MDGPLWGCYLYSQGSLAVVHPVLPWIIPPACVDTFPSSVGKRKQESDTRGRPRAGGPGPPGNKRYGTHWNQNAGADHRLTREDGKVIGAPTDCTPSQRRPGFGEPFWARFLLKTARPLTPP
ncbi:unnamed protein product [Lota lota]